MIIKKLSKKEKVLAGAIVILLFVIFCEKLIIGPVFGYWKSLNKGLESKSLTLLRDQRLLAREDSLRQKYAAFSSIIGKSSGGEENSAQVIAEIEKISKDAACPIVNLRPLALKNKSAYKEIQFDITSEGTIDDFMRFLYQVERSNKYLQVRRFTISSRSATPGKLKATFRIVKIIL